MSLGRGQRPFWRTRTLRYTLVVMSAIGCVLLFLLLSASSNTPRFEHAYPWILAANAVVTVAMLGLVSWLVLRLVRRYRAGVFGVRLMARFALSFALMGVIPGAVIYVVSVEFLSRSIESWFDVRVDNALESGLTLGRTVLDSMLTDVTNKARNMALALSDVQDTSLPSTLVRLRDQLGVDDALLLTASGKVVASAGNGDSLVPEMPSTALFRQLRVTRSYAAVESPLDGKSDQSALRMRVIVAVPTADLSLFAADPLYLQLVQKVPEAVARNADEVQNGMRDYQELSLSRASLRTMYTVTLTLALLLAVFAALGVAFLLATWLTAPLLMLAEGTKAVAGGDFSPMQDFSTRDELGTLMQSFNAMTRQLDEARHAVERNRVQLENAKTYLESILANLSAGVLVFDSEFRLVTVNQGAERILGTSFASSLGEHIQSLPKVATLAEAIGKAFGEQSGHSTDWQKQIELQRPGEGSEGGDAAPRQGGHDVEPLTLLARGSRCPVGEGEGYLVVFDDVSDVISAQRSIAWGEVARRLAHEIKNPLTPIQLSAERLQMKLAGKIPDVYGEYLERSVATIVNQVTAMKHMVDDFRDYAKTPTASMAAVDLNGLVGEVLGLYGVAAGRDSAGGIELHLGAELPFIIGDATRLRQVIHNLVQNAQDATLDRNDACVTITTERVETKTVTAPREAMVRLTVSDNGTGFPARILARAFEPYVTTKSRGTGLGLAVVKKIADEHEARVELRNGEAGGASVSLLFTRVAGRHLAVA